MIFDEINDYLKMEVLITIPLKHMPLSLYYYYYLYRFLTHLQIRYYRDGNIAIDLQSLIMSLNEFKLTQ